MKIEAFIAMILRQITDACDKDSTYSPRHVEFVLKVTIHGDVCQKHDDPVAELKVVV